MADYIYCGTDPPVDAEGTQALLAGPFQAIWFPPQSRMQGHPTAGSRIWLVWRGIDQALLLALGSGRVVETANGEAQWTERGLPGVRAAALQLGYGGPPNMTFIHCAEVIIAHGRPPVDVEGVNSGLNVATPRQVEVLSAVLPLM